jgi:hypothetical protein
MHHMAQLVETTKQLIAEFSFDTDSRYGTISEAIGRGEAAIARLQAESDAIPDGTVIGGLIWFPAADGRAYYKVVSEKPLKVMHIPYGDAWETNYATIRGLRVSDVQQHLERNRAIKELFAKLAKE